MDFGTKVHVRIVDDFMRLFEIFTAFFESRIVQLTKPFGVSFGPFSEHHRETPVAQCQYSK